ncbi:MAG: hypothetical protein KME57_16600 [Scytonema hyalinum WJT4-NPBG1]|nr:hypothetical protein [Scytonema hyalinum WJT4-NPBG1]
MLTVKNRLSCLGDVKMQGVEESRLGAFQGCDRLWHQRSGSPVLVSSW